MPSLSHWIWDLMQFLELQKIQLTLRGSADKFFQTWQPFISCVQDLRLRDLNMWSLCDAFRCSTLLHGGEGSLSSCCFLNISKLQIKNVRSFVLTYLQYFLTLFNSLILRNLYGFSCNVLYIA